MYLSPGDGIGIRVGLRNQILGVRVSSEAPYPVSSKVEHTTDNRKTEERYLYWVPVDSP